MGGGGMDKDRLRALLREADPAGPAGGHSFVFHGPVSFFVQAGATAIAASPPAGPPAREPAASQACCAHQKPRAD